MFHVGKALPAFKRALELILVPFQWTSFRWQCFKLRINLEALKDIYSLLVHLDWIDFVEVGPYQVQAFGLTACIQKGNYRFTISENMQKKQIYVHESYDGKEWVEVFRTNRHVNSTRFLIELVWLDRELAKLADSLPGPDSSNV